MPWECGGECDGRGYCESRQEEQAALDAEFDAEVVSSDEDVDYEI